MMLKGEINELRNNNINNPSAKNIFPKVKFL
jgi:hypothetical protein